MKNAKQVNYKFSEELIDNIDLAHIEFMSKTKVNISKSEFVRMAIKTGIEELKIKFDIK